MALTIGTNYAFDVAKPSPQPSVLGSKLVVSQITFDSSYAAGGLAVAASDFGLDELLALFITNGSGYAFEYDKTNKKIKAYIGNDAGTFDEAASSASLGAVSTWVLAVGR